MSWVVIAWSGFVATILAAAFFWTLRSLGWTKFSPTVQLGCLFLRDPRSPLTESLGFFLLILLGSTLVPAIYSALFTQISGPSWRLGALLGGAHGLLAAAVLPILGTNSACVRSGLLPRPGPLALDWGRVTPLGVLLGHLLYGSVLGAILAGF